MTWRCRITRLLLLQGLLCCATGQLVAKSPDVLVRVDEAIVQPVGLLLTGSYGGGLKPWCSVTLTRPDAVLTAFHCVSSTHSGDVIKVFFPYEGVREVNPGGIRPFCFKSGEAAAQIGPEGCSEWTDDLAVLELKEPYTLLQPLKLGDASVAGIHSKVTIAGFGYQDEALSVYGVSHQGETVISECELGTDRTFEKTDRALCFRFSGTASVETRIGPFDSGGPMFSIDAATGEQSLIGIALGSEPIGETGGTVRIARYVNLTGLFYRDWLEREAFTGTVVPAAHFTEMLVKNDVRELQPGKKAALKFSIGKSSERLLLTLNHDPGTSPLPNNLNLLLPDSLNATCERYASVEVCAVENPPEGSYRISVGWGETCGADGECGEPEYDSAYQVTAIALYGHPGARE